MREQNRQRCRRHTYQLVVFLALTLTILGRSLWGQEAELLISRGKLSKVHAEFSGLNNCGKCHTTGTKSVDKKCLACHEELAKRIDAGRGFHQDKIKGCPTCHPEHLGSDFPLVNWKPNEFDHMKSGYPLTGKHAAIRDCQKCHNARTSPPTKISISYLIKSNLCGFCHEDVHRGQFIQDCSTCHPVDVPFKEIRYDHERAAYRLKGAHQNLACEKCHPGKKWTRLKFAGCADCHLTNYDQTKNPNHITAGFPTACDACHRITDESWTQATFNHTWFPISSGRHLGNSCSACHTDPTNFKVFTCLTCHTRSSTDSGHSSVSGYDYNSANCFGCHPHGRAG